MAWTLKPYGIVGATRIFRRAPPGLQAHVRRDQIIHIQRQVRSVLLGRADRQEDYLLEFNGVVDFWPGQIGVEILSARHYPLRQSLLSGLKPCAAGRRHTHMRTLICVPSTLICQVGAYAGDRPDIGQS